MATCGFCVEGPIYYTSAMLQDLELQTKVTHQLVATAGPRGWRHGSQFYSERKEVQ